jgi:20S proteasome subunit beta 1
LVAEDLAEEMFQRPTSSLIQDPLDSLPTVSGGGGPVAAANDMFPIESIHGDPSLDAPVSLGTTIMAMAYDGGVVLAADSRTSTGSYVVNRAANKLTKLADNVYCCRSGSAADTQALAGYTSRYLGDHAMDIGTKPTVAAAASLFQRMCYNNRWNISAGIIVAGYDEINGGSVYNIPLGGASLKHPWAMGGSGSVFLYGWVDANFKAGMNKEQCLNFVRTAVAHAVARDGSSGGLTRTMAIDKHGAEHTMTPWNKIPYSLETDPEYKKMAQQNAVRGTSSKIEENKVDSTQ